jgi:hypothetical protein
MQMSEKAFSGLVGVDKERVFAFAKEYEVHRSEQKGRKHVLPPLDEILLLLLYLRHYPVDLFLAAAFLLPIGSISRVRQSMLDWFYETLKAKVTFNTLHERMSHSEKIFLSVYTWIIDGSEQGVTGCGQKVKDTLFYSAKKGKHTINILIIIDLNGFILYLSPSFPGLYADDALVEKTKDLWHHLFTDDENGLGDLGFKGMREKGVNLDVPPRNHKKPLYKTISTFRIRIEQRIADIKDWACCKQTLRIPTNQQEHLLDTHQKHWVIVAALLNEKKSASVSVIIMMRMLCLAKVTGTKRLDVL